MKKYILKISLIINLTLVLSAFFPCPAAFSAKDETQLTFSENIKEHFFLGDELFQKKDYTGALIEYGNIRNIDPAYIEGYLYPAKCYFQLEKYLEAGYFAAYTLYLDPANEEAKTILSDVKAKAAGTDLKDDALTYVLGPGEDLDKAVFRVYGSSLYMKAIVEQNGGKKDQKQGDKIVLPLDFSIVEGVKKLKKFDGTTLKYDLEALKEALIEQKERNLGDDAEGYFRISEDYLKINRVSKALMAYEMACYLDSKFIQRMNPEMISKALEETKKYIDKNPNSSNAYFYLAFSQFVQGNHTEALSNFSFSISYGLKAEYLSRSFKYTTLCKKNIKETEAKRIEKDALLKASADTSRSQAMVDVMKKTAPAEEDTKTEYSSKKPEPADEKTEVKPETKPAETDMDVSSMTKEQKIYYCYQQRKKIEEAVSKYNENNIIEMNMETYSLQRLRENNILKEDTRCPEGGELKMNHNGYLECSVHGL